jgi:pimeloyl-ACP methyl ester carboxylesterase
MLRSEKGITRRVFHKAKFGVDRFILVQTYKIHYVEAGAGEPVILIPGTYSTYRVWNRLMPLLAGDFRLLALDYVGTGDSDKPTKGFDYTVQEQTDIIVRMIRQMGLDKVSLIGGSYGGAIVFDFAARYPELTSKIVSIEGGVVRPDKIKGDPLEYCLRFPIVGDIFARVVRSGMLNKPMAKTVTGQWYVSMTPADRKEVLEQISFNTKSASRVPWYKISLASKISKDIEEEAKSIKIPVLYLYGTKSDFKEIHLEKNIKFFTKYLPNAWIEAVEGGIHDLAMQKPNEIADLILEFLKHKPD